MAECKCVPERTEKLCTLDWDMFALARVRVVCTFDGDGIIHVDSVCPTGRCEMWSDSNVLDMDCGLRRAVNTLTIMTRMYFNHLSFYAHAI